MAQRENRNQSASQGMFGKSLSDPKVIKMGGDADKATYNGLPVEVAIAAKQLLGKLRGGDGLKLSWDMATGADFSENAAPTGQKINRNAEVGAQDLQEMGGLSQERASKAYRVAIRAQCAKRCTRPGNVKCKYCLGAGFQKMSQMEGDPSHSVNRSRFQMAKEVTAPNNNHSSHEVPSSNHARFEMPTMRKTSKV